MIDILLATCDGRKHLPQQLDSILAQSFPEWRLLIRDDASTDSTPDLLREYAARHPGRIDLLQHRFGRIGACSNFGQLLARSEAPYVTFCDQDDVWRPDKLEILMAEMRRQETSFGKERPLLVHSDLEVIDEDGILLAHSFWRYQNLDPKRGGKLNRLLVQNVVTGNAALINAPLRDLCRSIPPEAIMHDWWVALVAAAFGRISHVPCATVRYRQHGENHIGARPWNCRSLAGRLLQAADLRSSLRRTQRQAAALARQFGPDLSRSQRELADVYAHLGERNFFARRIKLIQFKIFKIGLLRNCALLALV